VETKAPKKSTRSPRKKIMQHTSSEKISEALKLLEEAAVQKKDELQGVMTDKYTHLKQFILESEGSLMQSLGDAKNKAGEAVCHARDVGVDKARELAHDVDAKVHSNPWPYLAGTATFGLLLGLFLGRNNK